MSVAVKDPGKHHTFQPPVGLFSFQINIRLQVHILTVISIPGPQAFHKGKIILRRPDLRDAGIRLPGITQPGKHPFFQADNRRSHQKGTAQHIGDLSLPVIFVFLSCQIVLSFFACHVEGRDSICHQKTAPHIGCFYRSLF